MSGKPAYTLAFLLVTCFSAILTSNSQAADAITFERQPNALLIRAGGQPLATYVYRDPKILRPYFKDLCAPGGIQVTRHHPPREGHDRTDHDTMHPGLWLAFGDLSEADFWRNKARVQHGGFVKSPITLGNNASFSVLNEYVVGSRLICEEMCQYTILIRPSGYLIMWNSTFKSDKSAFYFGDQEEMGLGVRVATPLMVKPLKDDYKPGRILDDMGRRNEKEIWGHKALWADYAGWVDEKFVGITIMPDPRNFRACRWHTRDYGFMAANPFALEAFKAGPTSRTYVRPGRPFHLSFGIFIHAGADENSVDLKIAYADYLNLAKTY